MNINIRKRPKQYARHLLMSAIDGSLFPKISSKLKTVDLGGFKELGDHTYRDIRNDVQLNRTNGTLKYTAGINKPAAAHVFYPKWKYVDSWKINIPIAERWYNPNFRKPGECIFFDCNFMITTEIGLWSKKPETEYYGTLTVLFKNNKTNETPSKVCVKFTISFIKAMVNGTKQLSDCKASDIRSVEIKYGFFYDDGKPIWVTHEDEPELHCTYDYAHIECGVTCNAIERSYYIDDSYIDADDFNELPEVIEGKLKVLNV